MKNLCIRPYRLNKIKMHFVVDTVSEFTYFENILLGLADSLDKCVGVKQTNLKKLNPVMYSEISAWEHKQNVLLPEDLRSFYSSSNGYLFEWTYGFDDDNVEETIVGKIMLNSLEEVSSIFGYETTTETGVKLDGERYSLKLSPESKVFELCTISERGKVVLVYLYPKYAPTIWLLTTNMNFYYLADDIATYLRMAIVHLGIPNWELAYTPQGVPQWTENMFLILAPHLLPLNKRLEKMRQERKQRTDENYNDIIVNRLDPNVFKILPRSNVPQALLELPTSDSELTKHKKIKQQTQIKQINQQIKQHKLPRKPLYYVKKR